MEDTARTFYSSHLVRLELLPKPIYEKRKAEAAFYELHWQRLIAEEPLSAALGRDAFELAKRYGLAAVDALHVAAAIRLNVDEFITSEPPGKPLFRVKEVVILSLDRLG